MQQRKLWLAMALGGLRLLACRLTVAHEYSGRHWGLLAVQGRKFQSQKVCSNFVGHTSPAFFFAHELYQIFKDAVAPHDVWEQLQLGLDRAVANEGYLPVLCAGRAAWFTCQGISLKILIVWKLQQRRRTAGTTTTLSPPPPPPQTSEFCVKYADYLFEHERQQYVPKQSIA